MTKMAGLTILGKLSLANNSVTFLMSSSSWYSSTTMLGRCRFNLLSKDSAADWRCTILQTTFLDQWFPQHGNVDNDYDRQGRCNRGWEECRHCWGGEEHNRHQWHSHIQCIAWNLWERSLQGMRQPDWGHSIPSKSNARYTVEAEKEKGVVKG